MKDRFVIGSRGSTLALIQSEWVRAKILLVNPGVDVHIEVIKTSGDVSTEPLSVIGGKGVFTKELEDALLDCRIDVAVHSLKDLPAALPEGLAMAAICERQDPRDALVLPLNFDTNNASLQDLPDQAVVGTSSLRRLTQLKHLRPHLVIRDLRGNVDTRLRKLDEGEYDALILASAGLRRLGLENRISAAISPEKMLPAAGQGAIAIETRDGDDSVIDLVSALDHVATRLACTAERTMLKALGGGCQLPIAAHAVVRGDELRLDGLVANSSGNKIIRNHINGPCSEAERVGVELAAQLLKQGAGLLLNSQ
jgi:hydroxymethylbilane synthase